MYAVGLVASEGGNKPWPLMAECVRRQNQKQNSYNIVQRDHLLIGI